MVGADQCAAAVVQGKGGQQWLCEPGGLVGHDSPGYTRILKGTQQLVHAGKQFRFLADTGFVKIQETGVPLPVARVFWLQAKAQANHGPGTVGYVGADTFGWQGLKPVLLAQAIEAANKVRCGIYQCAVQVEQDRGRRPG